MSIGKRRRRLKSSSLMDGQQPDDAFIRAASGAYLVRYLDRRRHLTRETFEFLFWVVGAGVEQVTELFLDGLPPGAASEFREPLAEAQDDPAMLAEVLMDVAKKTRRSSAVKIHKDLLAMLKLHNQRSGSARKTPVESNLDRLREVFSFSRAEFELATFLLIIKVYAEAEDFLVDHLKCDRFRGRGRLLRLLNIGSPELAAAVNRFNRIDVIEHYGDQFELTDWFLNLCLSPESRSFSNNFYRGAPRCTLPLSAHAVDREKRRHVRRLLETKSGLPVHILLHGPPGTGKSSFAAALVSKLKDPAYEIICEEENKSKERRAALTACLKMTNSGRGSVVIVDEADNILNTMGSWFMRGETQDKGWLNRVMEEPGTRVIWITNSIAMIEESVLRRFAFSLQFKPFDRRRRVQLWESILSLNRAAGMLGPDRIEALARRYKVSAGVIDMAVKTAQAAAGPAQKQFDKAVAMALEAHQSLKNPGSYRPDEISVEDYSLEGLNIEGDVAALIGQLGRFDQVLRSDSEKRINMNLLFYGPPGTGKSALARHIADCLDREVICKRVSDLQSMWVGEGEKNIRRAFEEAESEEAVLVIDEADSVLFSRDRARHSWEISFTNEFLTAMERFRGILICTANRMTDLDQASIRRFNRKIRFSYLTHQGNIIFYEKFLAGMVKTPLGTGEASALKMIGNLAPGDFRNVRDRFAFQPAERLSHRELVEALAEESRLKEVHVQKRSIGFRRE